MYLTKHLHNITILIDYARTGNCCLELYVGTKTLWKIGIGIGTQCKDVSRLLDCKVLPKKSSLCNNSLALTQLEYMFTQIQLRKVDMTIKLKPSLVSCCLCEKQPLPCIRARSEPKVYKPQFSKSYRMICKFVHVCTKGTVLRSGCTQCVQAGWGGARREREESIWLWHVTKQMAHVWVRHKWRKHWSDIIRLADICLFVTLTAIRPEERWHRTDLKEYCKANRVISWRLTNWMPRVCAVLWLYMTYGVLEEHPYVVEQIIATVSLHSLQCTKNQPVRWRLRRKTGTSVKLQPWILISCKLADPQQIARRQNSPLTSDTVCHFWYPC